MTKPESPANSQTKSPADFPATTTDNIAGSYEIGGQQKIPGSALLLGLSGLIPFWASAAVLWLHGTIHHFAATIALAGYAAVILSFLGGINWGAAIVQQNAAQNSQQLPARLFWSIVPSLIAWFALLLQSLVNEGVALFILLVAFVLQYLSDRRAVSQGRFPPWFARLRLILTCGAVLALTVGLGGVLTR